MGGWVVGKLGGLVEKWLKGSVSSLVSGLIKKE